ncbi:MAG: PBP1A family penicillin-binding protein [Coprothermobacterota bacterium]|nr:PBP1A family penicillin-binding protein [Coprothermobacterota bacterium]
MSRQRPTLARMLLRFFTWFLSILLVLVVGVGVIGLVYLNRIGINPAEVLGMQLDQTPALTTEIYDRNGVLLAQLWQDEFRYYIPLNRIPAVLLQAVTATEDKNFWVHRGVDLEGTMRAVLANLRSGQIEEGGSTITQQLARALYHLDPRQTLQRKISEAILSLRLEASFSKEKILEMYLNQIFFGEGAYGVEAAARTYFGVGVEQLDLAQAALLAGLIVAPSKISPYRDPEGAKARQGEVLARMQRQGTIDQQLMEEAMAEPLRFHDLSVQAWKAPYFVDYVKGLLLDEYGPTILYQGGMRVTSSLDLRLQAFAEKAATEGVRYWQEQKEWPTDLVDALGVPQPQLALAAIDPTNGDLLAMVGGTDYASSNYNRASQAQRQPGSSFKIFDYATALESGVLKPYETLVSEPIKVQTGSESWEPSEYRDNPNSSEKRYYGPLTVRQALVQSSNIAAVKVALRAGLDNVIAMAHAMGITTDLQAVPSLAIGSCEVIPLEMAQAYGVLAKGGVKAQLRPILRVLNWDGSLRKSYQPSEQRVLSFQTAYQLTDYFQSVIRPTQAFIEGLPSAGKTGTTDMLRDAWFCGYTPALSCAVWTGADDASVPFFSSKNIGMYMPASIWRLFVEKAITILPKPDFLGYEESDLVTRHICKASGRLANPWCPEDQLVWETFVTGSEPDRTCNVHKEASPTPSPSVEVIPSPSSTPIPLPTPSSSATPSPPSLAPPVLSPTPPSVAPSEPSPSPSPSSTPPEDIQSLLTPTPIPSTGGPQ